jgi:hypothetical protein
VYQWEVDGHAAQQLADLSPAVRAALIAFMDAVVIVDPLQYQRRTDGPDSPARLLRTLHFGPHHEGPSRSWSTLLTTSFWSSASSG